MRTSTYEIILPIVGRDEKEIQGKKLLVNGLYGAMDVVDDETAAALEKDEPDDLPADVRESLASRGHITRRSVEGELKDVELLGRIHARTEARVTVGPVILPTYNCNCRCPYCFESHRLSRGEEWLKAGMKPEMVDAVFSALKKQREKGRIIEGCTLYGGEPFLKENKETVRNICEHAKAMGLKLNAVTNGYDLDHYIDLLKEYEFKKLQITVDGVGSTNDRRRLHRDGVPTYEKIMANIILALESGISISLRVNVNAGNIKGIRELIGDIERRGLNNHEKFSYYFKAVSEDLSSPDHVTEEMVMEELLRTGMPVMEAFEKQSMYSMQYSIIKELVKKESLPGYSTAYCGSEKGMAVIAPDGKVYPCWDFVGMDEYAVGHTDIGTGSFVYYFNRSKWKLRTSDKMEPCRTCPYIFVCRGGCASEAKKEHGSCFRENCSEKKEIFGFVASRVAGRKYEETGEKELSLSQYEPFSRLTEDERIRIMEEKDPNEIYKLIKEYGLVSPEAEKQDEMQL